MKNKSGEFRFETTMPSLMAMDVVSTKNLELSWLYGSPSIPAGSRFEIVDSIGPDEEWLPVTITWTDSSTEEVFLVDSSNIPRGFLTYKQWREEDEQCDDLSDVVSIPLDWWKDYLLSEREAAELLGLEVFILGKDARAKMLMNSRNEDDVDCRPLDLVRAAEEVSRGEDMCLRQCIDFLIGERMGLNHDLEFILVTDTNLIVSKRQKGFDLWYLTNNYLELLTGFTTLDAAKEYILKDSQE